MTQSVVVKYTYLSINWLLLTCFKALRLSNKILFDKFVLCSHFFVILDNYLQYHFENCTKESGRLLVKSCLRSQFQFRPIFGVQNICSSHFKENSTDEQSKNNIENTITKNNIYEKSMNL